MIYGVPAAANSAGYRDDRRQGEVAGRDQRWAQPRHVGSQLLL